MLQLFTPTIKVLILNEEPLVSCVLAELIDRQPNMEICGIALNVDAALEILESAQPDVALVDINAEGGRGIDLIRQNSARGGSTRMIVVGAFNDPDSIEHARFAGAVEFVEKHKASDVIVDVIRRVDPKGKEVSSRQLQSSYWLD